MRALIAYYTRTGNTEKAARIIGNMLSSAGAVVEFERINLLKEEGYFKSALGAILRIEVPILNTNFDVSAFDIVIVGSPVWALSTATPVNSYLEDIQGLAGKRAAAFVTKSSEVSDFAMNSMLHRMTKKGAKPTASCRLPKSSFISNEALKSEVKDFVKRIMV